MLHLGCRGTDVTYTGLMPKLWTETIAAHRRTVRDAILHAAAASPEPSRGRYLAAFQLSWALASVLAPGLFALLFAAGPTLAWTVFAALALGAGAATVLVEGRLPAGALRSESEHT